MESVDEERFDLRCGGGAAAAASSSLLGSSPHHHRHHASDDFLLQRAAVPRPPKFWLSLNWNTVSFWFQGFKFTLTAVSGFQPFSRLFEQPLTCRRQ